MSKSSSVYIQKLFSEAADRWDLDKIYKKIESIQQQFGQKQLSPQQKACLRGLLCGYNPAQIASHFPGESYGVIVNQILKLIRYIEMLPPRECKAIQDHNYIASCLAAAGFLKSEVRSQKSKVKSQKSEVRSFEGIRQEAKGLYSVRKPADNARQPIGRGLKPLEGVKGKPQEKTSDRYFDSNSPTKLYIDSKTDSKTKLYGLESHTEEMFRGGSKGGGGAEGQRDGGLSSVSGGAEGQNWIFSSVDSDIRDCESSEEHTIDTGAIDSSCVTNIEPKQNTSFLPYSKNDERVNTNAIAKHDRNTVVRRANSEAVNLTVVDSRASSLKLIEPECNNLTIVEANDFLPSISLWAQLSGLFVAGSVGIAIALAAFTPYNVTVKAKTLIRPAAGIKIVEAETQGTIVDIPVKENQTIRSGDVIATIDNSKLQTEKNLLESKVQQGQLQLGQINAQISSFNIQIKAESDRIQNVKEVASAELRRSRREYQDKKITTAAQVEEASANLRLAQQEWQQAQAESRSAQANLKSKLAELNAAKSKSKRYQSISATGALSKDQLEEVKLVVEQQQQEMLAQKASVEKQQRFIERQKQAMQAAQARLQNALAAIDPSNAEVTIAAKRITQEQASGKATLAQIDREKEVILQQRIEIQKQLERDTRELEQMTKNLSQTIIKAPTNGILFQLQLSNRGQTVQPGTAIARIAPEKTGLLVKASVSAGDISKVNINQAAQIKISACPYPDYGTLKGMVTQVSPDAIQLNSKDKTELNSNSSSSKSERIFYEVTIKPESLSLSQGNNKCSLQLGMEGNADIISQEETLLKFLLIKARLITNL
jgi:multidrug efflux pump subunit AcrA (membrane-fusion protein)